MKKKVVLYGAALLVLGGLTAWVYLGKVREPLDPKTLMEQALQAEELSDRVQAAAQLLAIKDPNPIPQMRQLLELSPDPEVKVQAIDGLAANLDHQSLRLFIGALNNSDERVRSAGHIALLRLYGGEFPNNIIYKADAPASERAKVVKKLLKLQEQHNQPSPKT